MPTVTALTGVLALLTTIDLEALNLTSPDPIGELFDAIANLSGQRTANVEGFCINAASLARRASDLLREVQAQHRKLLRMARVQADEGAIDHQVEYDEARYRAIIAVLKPLQKALSQAAQASAQPNREHLIGKVGAQVALALYRATLAAE